VNQEEIQVAGDNRWRTFLGGSREPDVAVKFSTVGFTKRARESVFDQKRTTGQINRRKKNRSLEKNKVVIPTIPIRRVPLKNAVPNQWGD